MQKNNFFLFNIIESIPFIEQNYINISFQKCLDQKILLPFQVSSFFYKKLAKHSPYYLTALIRTLDDGLPEKKNNLREVYE